MRERGQGEEWRGEEGKEGKGGKKRKGESKG